VPTQSALACSVAPAASAAWELFVPTRRLRRPADELREPLPFRLAPAGGERAVGGVLGGLERLAHDPGACFGEHDEREAGIALVRLPVDEPDPLERAELTRDARGRDPEPLSQLRPAQLPLGRTVELTQDREVGERDPVPGQRKINFTRELGAAEREVEEGVECARHALHYINNSTICQQTWPISRPGRECGNCRLGFVAHALDAAVDDSLEPGAKAGWVYEGIVAGTLRLMQSPLWQRTRFVHWSAMSKPGGHSVGMRPAGIALGVGLLLLVAFLAMGVTWSIHASASSQTAGAQKTIASAFLTPSGAAIADVRTCFQIKAGGATQIVRCSVAAPNCRRSFLFRVSRTTSRVSPYDQPRTVFISPCDFASDPAGDLS
jgi:hypothetical protein